MNTKHTGELATCDFCRAEAPVLRKYLRRANKDRKIGDGFTITKYCQECGLEEEPDTDHTDSVEAIVDKMLAIGWSPGNKAHIKAVLQGKHPGKTIIIQHRMGGEVDYLVGDKTK